MAEEIVDASLSLSAEEKRARSSSFGEVASQYERFRPAPREEAVAWILPDSATRVVDLGAGTGALSRILTDKVEEVFAVEPDDRMRAVLEQEVRGVTALAGRGEAIPLPTLLWMPSSLLLLGTGWTRSLRSMRSQGFSFLVGSSEHCGQAQIQRARFWSKRRR
jgi:SAM-dependent methyltransferase